MQALFKSTVFLMICSVATLAKGAPNWDWQLSEPINAPRGIDIFDTDPDSVSANTIRRLNLSDVYTICYVSVGTVEDYRDDAAAFPASVIGRTYEDWPDERFLDIRRLDVLLPLMQARFQRCKDMGFQAIEPDNMDVFDNASGFPLSRNDGLRYIIALADMAHGMGLEIGQKNVPELTKELVEVMDFAITEGCYVDGWCGDVFAYIRAKKPVLAAEYTDSSINWPAACAFARANSYSMILKDRDLSTRLHICPEGD